MTPLYNVRLIAYQMGQLDLSIDGLAKAANVSYFSAWQAVNGRLATLKKLKCFTDALKIKWEYITHTDLPEKEFHRAVLTNGDRRGRSVKPGSRPVGVARPRVL